jgi:hypothetical protein
MISCEFKKSIRDEKVFCQETEQNFSLRSDLCTMAKTYVNNRTRMDIRETVLNF